ncbi:MAG: HlyD family secretion protein [Fimbriiglobus sp.]
MFTRYLLPFAAVVALGFAVVQMTNAQQKPPPAVPPVEPAKSPFANQLAGAGIVEPDTENIAIGSHLPGIVERVFVKVGDAVRPGDPLFRLDDRQLKAELEIRTANVANAKAALEKLNRMPRAEELPPAEAKVLEAEANVRDQEKMYARVRRLAGTNAISDEEFMRREIAVQIASAQLKQAKGEYELLAAGAWKLDKDVAAVAVRLAEAQANQTRTELDRLTVLAPRLKWDGPVAGPGAAADATEFHVLQVTVHPGEFVGTMAGQPLVVLGSVGKLHVRVDIDENDIGRFRPNLPGVAKPRGGGDTEYPISFVRVEPYVIPKKSLTGGNSERVDTRVLQVIYAIDTAGKPMYVGQQMDVFLDAAAKN